MRNWTLGSSSAFQLQANDHFLALGIGGRASGAYLEEVSDAFPQAVADSLSSQDKGEYKGGEWVVASGKRCWTQPVVDKPGLDGMERVRCAAAEGWKTVTSRRPERVVLLADALSPDELEAAFEGWWISTYRYDSWKSKPAPSPIPLFVLADAAEENALRTRLEKKAVELESTDWTRDQVNEPGSILYPQELGRRMEQELSRSGVSWRSTTRPDLDREGYHGLVTVGKGSDHAPVLGVGEWKPADARPGIHLVLVGKGVTFDTGGISLKPSEHMWEMKNDMAGAATAVGALRAIARLRLPLRVSAVVCLAENRPGNGSALPGDIFRAKNGKSVMVDNTDAEGRLILTDGLWEAGSLGATHIVDLATLTGVVVRALGSSVAGVLANDEELADVIRASGLPQGEKFWPLPLEEEYRPRLDDTVADLKNTGGVEAGTITAGLFLKEFVPENARWAHLDIAGTAFTTKSWKYFPEGATAFGLRTLVELARRLAATA